LEAIFPLLTFLDPFVIPFSFSCLIFVEMCEQNSENKIIMKLLFP